MKWTTQAGPIQTKKVQKALNKISWEGRSFTNLSGTKGVDERESTYTELSGDVRKEATEAIAAIFTKYGGVVTKENCAAIIADTEAAVEALTKTRPVKDERTTPVENAERNAKWALMEAEQAVEAKKKAAAVEAIVAELKSLYPWAKQDGSGYARAAYNVKKELTLAFPGVEFRVKSESYSMGNSVNIYWTLGPTTAEVKEISDKYQAGNFDGMTDSYDYDHSVESAAARVVLGQSKYVFENRNEQGMTDRIGEDLCKLQKVAYVGPNTGNLMGAGDYNRTVRDHAYQLLAKTSFPAGSQYKGVRYATTEEQNGQTWVVIEFEPAGTPALKGGENNV